MSTFYSDHYTVGTPNDAVTPNVGLAPDDPRIKVTPGHKHAAIRYSRASILMTSLANPAGTDFIRMMSLKSSDRILDLFALGVGNTSTAGNVGVYLAGDDNAGAVVDADLFASAFLFTTVTRTDIFAESAVLADEDRGKQLWELALIGAGTDTEDPHVMYDIGIDLTAAGTEDTIILECYYVAGGN